jgi:hypothetical protein
MTTIADPLSETGSAGTWTLWLAIVVLGAVLLFKDHDPTVSLHQYWAPWSEEEVISAAGGNPLKGLALSAIAVLGLVFLQSPRGRRLQVDNPLALLLIAAFAWCLASICWSCDYGRTARQAAALAFCFVGALGIARQVSPRGL